MWFQFSASVEWTDSLIDRWPIYDELKKTFIDAMGDKDSGFVYSGSLVGAYLAYAILGLAIDTLIFACIGVFLVLLFLMDLRMSMFIVFTIGLIDIDLFGWMILFGVPLDVISYGQLVMAVGLTVDYVIHIAHAISHAHPIHGNTRSKLEKDGKDQKDSKSEKDGKDGDEKKTNENETNDTNDDNDDDSMHYDERIENALIDMGTGVAKGSMTTFLGIMTLIFSQSQAFRVFFIMFCGIILIAVLHGFLFVPAVLGEFQAIFYVEENIQDEHDVNDPIPPKLSQKILEKKVNGGDVVDNQ